MSGAVLTILMMLHVVMWLVQLAFNAQTGAGQCGVATFACGSGVLENLLSVPNELSGAGGSALGGVPVVGAVAGFIGASIGLLKSLWGVIQALLFFEYTWLAGGGAVTDLTVLIIKGVLACLFIAAGLRMATSIIRR